MRADLKVGPYDHREDSITGRTVYA